MHSKRTYKMLVVFLKSSPICLLVSFKECMRETGFVFKKILQNVTTT